MTTDKNVLACAEIAHEANRIYCAATGDASQVPWSQAPEWQRESAVRGVQTALDGATPQEQHAAWMRDKVADGWVYGETKDAERKTHPCIVSYDQLPAVQRAKDALFGSVVRAMRTALYQSGPVTIDAGSVTIGTRRALHPSVTGVLRFFAYAHLPPKLQTISRPFHDLAHSLAATLDGPEFTVALRKLLESKDAAVRAAMDLPE